MPCPNAPQATARHPSGNALPFFVLESSTATNSSITPSSFAGHGMPCPYRRQPNTVIASSRVLQRHASGDLRHRQDCLCCQNRACTLHRRRTAQLAQPSLAALRATTTARRILLRRALRRASRRDPRTQQHRAPAAISSRRAAATTYTPMPKKRNTSAPAASPAIAGDATTKSAARTRRTRSSKRNRSNLASPAAINAALALAFGDATTIASSSSSSSTCAAKSAPAARSSRPSARAPKSSAPAAESSSATRAAKSSGSAAAASASSPRGAKSAPSAASATRKRAPKRKRVQSSPVAAAAPPSTPAAAIDARPVSAAQQSSTAPPPRIRIGEAMRRSGLDEYKVARTFAGVVDKLSDGTKDTGGVQKLLVDVLKECSRHLDPPQTERAASAAPVHITMVHNVPRPFRAQAPQQQPQLNAAPPTE